MWNVPTIIEPFNNIIEAYYMESDLHSDVRYAVTLSADGSWSCSCPDWMYRRPENGCKHVNRVKVWRRENQKNIQVARIPQSMPRFAALDV